MKTLKSIALFIAPHGLVKKYIKLKSGQKTDYRLLDQRKAEEIANELDTKSTKQQSKPLDYNYVVDYFVDTFHIDKSHILSGSIGPKNCDRMVYTILEHFDKSRIIGLNIGNFLGVAFSYILSRVVHNNNESTLISVDPNIPHRGIENLEDKFIASLGAFNLEDNSLIINGYSLNKNLSNDGVTFNHYDPEKFYNQENGCTGVLQKLVYLGVEKLNFILLDGNHHSEYLQQEMKICSQLLQSGGILFLDDIDENWKLLKTSALNFLKENESVFSELYYDGRILALKKK